MHSMGGRPGPSVFPGPSPAMSLPLAFKNKSTGSAIGRSLPARPEESANRLRLMGGVKPRRFPSTGAVQTDARMHVGTRGQRSPLLLRSLSVAGLAIACQVSCLLGCSAPPRAGRPPVHAAAAAAPSDRKEPPAKVVIRGSDRMNVDEFGQSLAVVVRVYQLKTAKSLEDAEFDYIWQHDRESLADEVVSTDELTLAPTEVRVIHMKRAEDA